MFGFFKKKPTNALEEFIFTVYGNPPPPKTAILNEAIQIAHEELLMGIVSREKVTKLATELNSGPIPYSTHDLALSVASNFFKQADLIPLLFDAQLVARMKALEWMKQKKVVPSLVQSFEDTLYKLYKLGGLPPNTKDDEIVLAARIEEGEEKLARIIFSLPFALNKLIALGKMVESGDAPLKDIIQNGDEELDEDHTFERERFYGVTLRIKELYQKRRLLLKKLKEADKELKKKVIRVLTDNRELILEEVRQLQLNNYVIVALSDELKKAVMNLEDLSIQISSVAERAKYLGVDMDKIRSGVLPRNIKNKAVVVEIKKLSSEYGINIEKINEIEDIFGISYEEMKKALRILIEEEREIEIAKGKLTEATAGCNQHSPKYKNR